MSYARPCVFCLPRAIPLYTGANLRLVSREKIMGDDKTQVGVFAELENAKEHADANKSDGYKVFDPDGNLVYGAVRD